MIAGGAALAQVSEVATVPRRGERIVHKEIQTLALSLGTGVLVCLWSTAVAAAEPADPSSASRPQVGSVNQAVGLVEGFANPPMSARPRAWWHWVSGNITRDGIAADLQWMKDVGLGGAQAFDAGLTQRQVVKQQLSFMSAGWQDAFRFAAATADQLGLDLGIASSPGWSLTGGPWVEPGQAMKKLVWSSTVVEGGRHFRGVLTQPPSVTGPYQDMARSGAKQSAYGDALVLAYLEPALPDDASPNYASHGVVLDATRLTDDRVDTFVPVSVDGTSAQLDIAYARPATVSAATIFIRDGWNMFVEPAGLPRLEVKDGAGWRTLAELPLGPVPTTVSFAPTTSDTFRLTIGPAPGRATARGPTLRVSELRLTAAPMVNRFESKAGFSIADDYPSLGSPPDAEVQGIDPARVIDLTGKLAADGTLEWSPPKGRWRVLRLGWSLLGVVNHPASPEATGLEVDKYDATAVRAYMDHYLSMYRGAAGPGLLGTRGVNGLITDSIEVGASNWTPRIVERFKSLRGYDPTPYLPALTGAIVGSRAVSDGFLFDFRRTLADLIASDHYGEVARAAHDAGLTVYGESLEGMRVVLGDDMSMRSHADVPMAALWAYPVDGQPAPGGVADMRGAASVAHVYGRPFVATESMTSRLKLWAYAPADLRHVIDMEFAHGINRPVIHSTVHQPLDDAPGISLSIFGQTFNRLETWAGMARPWMDYIARGSFLLQQGRNVADVAYFSGEDAPILALRGDEPRRYAYDFVNGDMLRGVLSVDDGAIVSAGGARYRALFLGGSSRYLTLQTLRRIERLVEEGGVVIGAAPLASPSLADAHTSARSEYEALVDRLWSGSPVTAVGRGRVIVAGNPEAGMVAIGVAPDFTYSGGSVDSAVLFVHRRTDDADIYFVNNSRVGAERIEARFRVSGRQPEIWYADTGTRRAASFRIDGEHTTVPLNLAGHESLFVVFRKPAASSALEVKDPVLEPRLEIKGPWQVAFQPDRGAPASITLPALASLTEQSDPGIRYFSGVAAYRNAFNLPRSVRKGTTLWLDLGKVGDLAEVRVNGVLVGTAWHSPFRLDISGQVKSGRNTLEIKVANLWVNRLIGDRQPGAVKVTSTIFPTYAADAPLRAAGLIGPVTILGPREP